MKKPFDAHSVTFCCEISDEDYHNPTLEAQIFDQMAEKVISSVSGGNIFMKNSVDDLLVPLDENCHLKKVG